MSVPPKPNSLSHDFATIMKEIQAPLPKKESPLDRLSARLRQNVLRHRTAIQTGAAIVGLGAGALAEVDFFVHNVYSPSFVVLTVLPSIPLLYQKARIFGRAYGSGQPFRNAWRRFLKGSTALYQALRTKPLLFAAQFLLLTAAGLAAANMTQNVLHPLPSEKPRMLRMMQAETQHRLPVVPSSIRLPAAHAPSTVSASDVPPPPPKRVPPPRPREKTTSLSREEYMTPRPFVPN